MGSGELLIKHKQNVKRYFLERIQQGRDQTLSLDREYLIETASVTSTKRDGLDKEGKTAVSTMFDDLGFGDAVRFKDKAELKDDAQQESPSTEEGSILMRMLSARDEEALGMVSSRYGSQLMSYAHHLVGDKQLAEEIQQDTLHKMWQVAPELRAEGHLKAWLFTVAKNNAIDHLRKKRLYTEEYTACSETASLNFQPEREAEKTWLAQEVREAIEELPSSYRDVVNLRFFQQRCYQEISVLLDVPLGTVKSRLNYALQRLGKILNDRGIDPTML